MEKLSVARAFLGFSQLINFIMPLGIVSGFEQRLTLQILPVVEGFRRTGHEDGRLYPNNRQSRWLCPSGKTESLDHDELRLLPLVHTLL